MKRALRLAEKGLGFTLPNPMVGAVIVKNGERISEGYHHGVGQAHAEVEALQSCTRSPKGATLFVTLEPCCHFGKTPPCTEAIIKSGIQKVVIASMDPSDKVNGKGIELLRASGIEVEQGCLDEENQELNRDFFCYFLKKRPRVTMKVALSLDGKIAQNPTEPFPLTGPASQKQVHLLRSRHQAIMVGGGTVLADNPHLGVRAVEGRDPLRVILQGKEKLPTDAQIFRDTNVLVLKNKTLEEVLEELYEKEIRSVLIEGGQKVFTSALESGLVDELHVFYAPLLLGEDALSFTKSSVQSAFRITHSKTLGQDLWLTLKPKQAK